MMSVGSTGIFVFITFCLVVTLISATPVIAVSSGSDDIIGQLINKRNSWWSKKSSLPLLRQFSGDISADAAFCGKMMSIFKCYIYGCVDKMATCARESGMSGRGYDTCQLELRMCGLKCVTDSSRVDN